VRGSASSLNHSSPAAAAASSISDDAQLRRIGTAEYRLGRGAGLRVDQARKVDLVVLGIGRHPINLRHEARRCEAGNEITQRSRLWDSSPAAVGNHVQSTRTTAALPQKSAAFLTLPNNEATGSISSRLTQSHRGSVVLHWPLLFSYCDLLSPPRATAIPLARLVALASYGRRFGTDRVDERTPS